MPTVCKNTMHSWGLEMFWVILWRECLLFVKTLCTAEVWKCSGLFCEDSAYSYINTMHSWGLEMFWVILWRQSLMFVQTLCSDEVWKCSGLFCEDSAYCLYKHYAQLRSGNVLGYSVKTVLIACINTMHSCICLEMFWLMLCRQSLLLVQKVCKAEFVQKFIRIKFITENVYSYGRNK